MNNSIDQNQPSKKPSESNSSKILFEAGKILFIYAILSYILSILFFDILFPNYFRHSTGFDKFTYSFIFIISMVLFIESIMINTLTITVYKRTGYAVYLLEGLSFILIPILYFILLILYFYYPALSIGFIIVYVIFLGQYQFIKKPLVWEKPYERRLQYNNPQSRSDIILRQSLFIDDYNDGYSPRPFFTDFSDVVDKLTDERTIKKQSLRFAKFLAINGDLIGYSYTDNKLNLYLRTSYIKKSEVAYPISFYKKIRNILANKEITTVIFDFSTKEMNFILNKTDYIGLDDITYHKFVERMLTQFKIGFKLFLEEKYIESYNEIVPKWVKIRPGVLDDNKKAFTIILYMVGVIIIGIPYLIGANMLNLLGFEVNSIYIFFWPVADLVGISYVYGILTGTYNSTYFLSYIPTIILLHLLTLGLTILIYYFIHKIQLEERINPNKGLKIPL